MREVSELILTRKYTITIDYTLLLLFNFIWLKEISLTQLIKNRFWDETKKQCCLRIRRSLYQSIYRFPFIQIFISNDHWLNDQHLLFPPRGLARLWPLTRPPLHTSLDVPSVHADVQSIHCLSNNFCSCSCTQNKTPIYGENNLQKCIMGKIRLIHNSICCIHRILWFFVSITLFQRIVDSI